MSRMYLSNKSSDKVLARAHWKRLPVIPGGMIFSFLKANLKKPHSYANYKYKYFSIESDLRAH